MYLKIYQIYYNVHIFCKTLGGGAENNPERSSISDECYFYAKYDKNASTRVCFFNLSGSKITNSKSVVKCVAIIIIFIINNGTFLGRNLIKIIYQNAPDCINHFKFFAGACPRTP